MGITPLGAIDHSFFGLGSEIVSLVAVVFGIQALYAAGQEPRWKRGNGFALTGLVLGDLPLTLYVLLFSFLLPVLLIAERGGLVVMLMVFLLRLAIRTFRSHRS